MSDKSAKDTARCQNNKLMPTSALKRKFQPEIGIFCTKEMKILNDEKIIIELNDVCDDVIDLILCHLQLGDLANIADTNTRLKSIAGSVFSRKYAHRLISIDTFHYSRKLNAHEREYNEEKCSIYCKDRAIVRITDAKIWFKLMRNFGGFIKFIRIQGCHYRRDTYILSALQNLKKYVSEFCSASLNTLELYNFQFFTLNKPLTKLQEFFFYGPFEISEALELMPNVRNMKLFGVPRILEKHYVKLERVELHLRGEEVVHSFHSFLRMNRQIKYLRLCITSGLECISFNHNDSICSSIAENLTQLKTLKLLIYNAPIETSTYHIKTLESFSFEGVTIPASFIPFELNNLRKFTLRSPSFLIWLNFILRNKKLKILKFEYFNETCLKASIIRNMLSQLPELEQIIVQSYDEKIYSIWKNILGTEWEQIEIKKIYLFRSVLRPITQIFKKKLNSK